MISRKNLSHVSLGLLLAGVVALSAGCAMYDRMMGKSQELSGAQEVPPVKTAASGSTNIRVKDDRTVSGTATVSGMKPTAAHIHQAPAGSNGPVIIGLTKTSDTSFRVPDGATLTPKQYEAYKAGHLYVNVHSAAHPGGEVRAQLKP